MVAWPELRSLHSNAANIGGTVEQLTRFINGSRMDLGALKHGWESVKHFKDMQKSMRLRAVMFKLLALVEETIEKRAFKMNRYAYGRSDHKDIEIALVTHGSLRYAFHQQVTGVGKHNRTS